jgi:hypothetical protein
MLSKLSDFLRCSHMYWVYKPHINGYIKFSLYIKISFFGAHNFPVISIWNTHADLHMVRLAPATWLCRSRKYLGFGHLFYSGMGGYKQYDPFINFGGHKYCIYKMCIHRGHAINCATSSRPARIMWFCFAHNPRWRPKKETTPMASHDDDRDLTSSPPQRTIKHQPLVLDRPSFNHNVRRF